MAAASTVRRAKLDDLPQVCRLAGALVRLHHAFDQQRFMLVEPVEEGYLGFFSRELERPMAVLLVAVDPLADGTDHVRGYAYGTLEPRSWNDLLDSCGKLHDVFVDPAARGRGLGGALVAAMAEAMRLKGAPRLVLSSATQNAAAQALFAKLGFRPTMVEMTCELDR